MDTAKLASLYQGVLGSIGFGYVPFEIGGDSPKMAELMKRLAFESGPDHPWESVMVQNKLPEEESPAKEMADMIASQILDLKRKTVEVLESKFGGKDPAEYRLVALGGEFMVPFVLEGDDGISLLMDSTYFFGERK